MQTSQAQSNDRPPSADTGDSDVAHPAICENCGTRLQGHYCHRCGQTAHNPVRHLGHAIEEVFESFWHLDGRIFRTLRELLLPGRVAKAYLAGHRVRYIPPLRLFVILSLLTFFVGKLVLHVDNNVQTGFDEREIAAAQTVEQVRQVQSRLLAEVDAAEARRADTPGVDPALIAKRVRIEGEAASRIAELRAQAARPATNPDAAAAIDASSPARVPGSKATTAPHSKPAPGTDASGDPSPDAAVQIDGDEQAFFCKTDSVGAAWLPDFANGWLKGRARKSCDNIERLETDTDSVVQAILAAIPTALFLLMPVFALLLKIVYLGSGRSYLEHLVVALYSHAYLLLVLLALFLIVALDDNAIPAWLETIADVATGLLLLWIPIYLWKMQRRVYGGGWVSNLVRYLVIGNVYFVLVGFAAVYAGFMGLSS